MLCILKRACCALDVNSSGTICETSRLEASMLLVCTDSLSPPLPDMSIGRL